MDHIELAHTTHTPGYRNEKRSFSLRCSSRSPKFFPFPPLIDLKVQNFRPIAAYCGSFCRVFVSSVRRSSFFVLFSAHFVVKSYLYVVRHLFALFRLAETRSAPVFVMFVLFVRHDALSHLHVIVPVTRSLEKSLGSSTEKLKTQSAVARSLLPNFFAASAGLRSTRICSSAESLRKSSELFPPLVYSVVPGEIVLLLFEDEAYLRSQPSTPFFASPAEHRFERQWNAFSRQVSPFSCSCGQCRHLYLCWRSTF